jgi:hypothetical protein
MPERFTRSAARAPGLQQGSHYVEIRAPLRPNHEGRQIIASNEDKAWRLGVVELEVVDDLVGDRL